MPLTFLLIGGKNDTTQTNIGRIRKTVLEMMAEFEQTQSAHDGGFWNANNFVYEEWLKENLQAEAGLNIPEKLGSCYPAG